MLCKQKDCSTGEAPKDYFANKSILVTYTFKLLMSTFLTSVPRILRGKNTDAVTLVLFVCFCLFVVSGSHRTLFCFILFP